MKTGPTQEDLRELERELWAAGERLKGEPTRWMFQVAERDLRTKVAAARQAIAAEAERRAEMVHRATVTAALRPLPDFRRAFIQDLNQHAIEVSTTHRVHVVRTFTRPHASVLTRTISTPPIYLESDYAVWIHEIAHVLSVDAQSLQHRHTVRGNSCVSPAAEVQAWRWAVQHALRWTPEMQACLRDSIDTYRVSANSDERIAITDLIRWSEDHVRPAPDTLEGKMHRVEQIKREDRMRQLRHEQAPSRARFAALDARIAEGWR